jgi:hypothetical protein
VEEQRSRRALGIPDSRTGSYLNLESELIALRRALRTTSGSLLVRVPLQSENYVPNAQGWKFDLNGNVELNNALIRGTLAAADGVFTGNLSATQITADFLSVNRIQNGSLTGGKLANQTITATQIANAAIGANQINNGAIIADKIANGAVTAAKIASLTITANEIANLTIDASKIMNLQINSDKLSSNAVTTVKIANLAVTDAKISLLNVDKLSGVTISGFNGNFLSFQALAVTSTLNNMIAPGFSVSSSNSFYGNTSRVASTLRYDGAPSITTTTGSNNVFRRGTDNVLVIFTSSKKFKTDIENAPMYPIDKIRPVVYRGTQEGDENLQFGLIAEELAELDIPGLVSYDNDGEPMGVNYSMIGLLLVDHVRKLNQRVKELEANQND